MMDVARFMHNSTGARAADDDLVMTWLILLDAALVVEHIVIRCTTPETTASPSPVDASTTIVVRSPLTGSAVNMTPATSALIMRWTTTAILTSSESIPIRLRYAMARSVHRDAQHRRIASITVPWPTTFR